VLLFKTLPPLPLCRTPAIASAHACAYLLRLRGVGFTQDGRFHRSPFQRVHAATRRHYRWRLDTTTRLRFLPCPACLRRGVRLPPALHTTHTYILPMPLPAPYAYKRGGTYSIHACHTLHRLTYPFHLLPLRCVLRIHWHRYLPTTTAYRNATPPIPRCCPYVFHAFTHLFYLPCNVCHHANVCGITQRRHALLPLASRDTTPTCPTPTASAYRLLPFLFCRPPPVIRIFPTDAACLRTYRCCAARPRSDVRWTPPACILTGLVRRTRANMTRYTTTTLGPFAAMPRLRATLPFAACPTVPRVYQLPYRPSRHHVFTTAYGHCGLRWRAVRRARTAATRLAATC